MAMLHDFILLNTAEAPYSDYMKYIKYPKFDVSIADDLIIYVYDYLNWIPTINPASSSAPETFGLHLYGPTVIDMHGAEQAVKIFTAIAGLFACANEHMKLTGAFSHQLADSFDAEPGIERIVAGSGQYASLLLRRQDVVKQFERLAELCQKVKDSDGALYVLHLGI